MSRMKKPIKKGRAVTRPENKRTPQMYRNNPAMSTNFQKERERSFTYATEQIGYTKKQLERIEKRRSDMPLKYRSDYDRAMRGRSKNAGIKAFCLQCMGWSITEVKACNTVDLYRPYRNAPPPQKCRGERCRIDELRRCGSKGQVKPETR